MPAPFPKSRIEALTDGIFAVTMTLLVLDLLEIEARTELQFAPYFYLLVLIAGMLRPVIRRPSAAGDDDR